MRGKIIEYDILDDSNPTPEIFKASYKKINGRKALVVQAHSKQVNGPNGRKDVIISLPSLSLINKFNQENSDG